ncbi:acyl-CoA dehydrogenase family protein [Bordetella sp. BOR01]|uniref:acyl-CoA dehydrogenase family protein n=1 Tax=Bordetella sp. BOR01 TaxID=2854779 RepID=UPI001C4524B6|nr:acyl-CoA dehydrogenase family protein [Bordetella sp. BOR01]MBV7484653.1 acyl-CoA dehydrogenase family protein [Bordetella sp. BOR01]
MHFDYTDEQQQFADALSRWLQKHYTFEHRVDVVARQAGICQEDWRQLAELGVFAITAPDAADGFDGDSVDLMLVMQEMGRHLVVEPVLDTLVGIDVLKQAGADSALLAAIGAGTNRVSCAFFERDARYDLSAIATTATAVEGGYRLDGRKHLVTHGATADLLIVSARMARPDGATEVALFCVPAKSEGVGLTAYRSIDGQRAADLVLQQVFVPAAAALPADGQATLGRAQDMAAMALCAEGLGVMQALNQATFDYLKTRKQFGVPLGTFQALQHRCADMYMEFEQARVLTMLAAARLRHAGSPEQRRAVSAAKVKVNKALRFIGEQAVHLHGGIGLTDELPVSHYFRRGTLIAKQFGDTGHHLGRFMRQPGFDPEAGQD